MKWLLIPRTVSPNLQSHTQCLNYSQPLQVSEPVPEGVNIFNIMNLSAPSNVSQMGSWSVLVNPNSTVYAQISGQFEVRNGSGSDFDPEMINISGRSVRTREYAEYLVRAKVYI